MTSLYQHGSAAVVSMRSVQYFSAERLELDNRQSRECSSQLRRSKLQLLLVEHLFYLTTTDGRSSRSFGAGRLADACWRRGPEQPAQANATRVASGRCDHVASRKEPAPPDAILLLAHSLMCVVRVRRWRRNCRERGHIVAADTVLADRTGART